MTIIKLNVIILKLKETGLKKIIEDLQYQIKYLISMGIQIYQISNQMGKNL